MMLAEQENQENVPPGGKAPPPPAAGTRVALGLLRGAQKRPGVPPQVRGEREDRGGAGGGRCEWRGPPSWGAGSCQRRLSAAGPCRAVGGADGPFSSQAERGGGEGHGAAVGRPVGGQQAFTIHVDEPDGEQRRRGGPATQKEEAALGLRAAVCALGERRPLAPLNNAMELSFGT